MRLATAAVMIVLPLSVEAGELRITVDGIRSPHGTVLIGLYDSSASFGRAVEASAKEGFLVDPDRFAAWSVAMMAGPIADGTVLHWKAEATWRQGWPQGYRPGWGIRTLARGESRYSSEEDCPFRSD